MAYSSGCTPPPSSPPDKRKVHFTIPPSPDQDRSGGTRFSTTERIHQIENTLIKVGLIAGMIVLIAVSALAIGVSCAAIYHGDWYISMAGAVMAFTCITACFDLKEIMNENIK